MASRAASCVYSGRNSQATVRLCKNNHTRSKNIAVVVPGVGSGRRPLVFPGLAYALDLSDPSRRSFRFLSSKSQPFLLPSLDSTRLAAFLGLSLDASYALLSTICPVSSCLSSSPVVWAQLVCLIHPLILLPTLSIHRSETPALTNPPAHGVTTWPTWGRHSTKRCSLHRSLHPRPACIDLDNFSTTHSPSAPPP